jgi:hypothetical protein
MVVKYCLCWKTLWCSEDKDERHCGAARIKIIECQVWWLTICGVMMTVVIGIWWLSLASYCTSMVCCVDDWWFLGMKDIVVQWG